jgi:hypothetical protein
MISLYPVRGDERTPCTAHPDADASWWMSHPTRPPLYLCATCFFDLCSTVDDVTGVST